MTEADIIRVEAGGDGLIGEVQDYLTGQGVNVSAMAIGHSEFLAALRDQFPADEGTGGNLRPEE